MSEWRNKWKGGNINPWAALHFITADGDFCFFWGFKSWLTTGLIPRSRAEPSSEKWTTPCWTVIPVSVPFGNPGQGQASIFSREHVRIRISGAFGTVWETELRRPWVPIFLLWELTPYLEALPSLWNSCSTSWKWQETKCFTAMCQVAWCISCSNKCKMIL